VKLTITAGQARDLACGSANPELGLTIELNEQIDTRRWVSVHRLVVKDTGGIYWATTYEQGLTESQDIWPFEDVSEVVFEAVEKVPVTTCEYRLVTVEDL
jgi:hypothetical protein